MEILGVQQAFLKHGITHTVRFSPFSVIVVENVQVNTFTDGDLTSCCLPTSKPLSWEQFLFMVNKTVTIEIFSYNSSPVLTNQSSSWMRVHQPYHCLSSVTFPAVKLYVHCSSFCFLFISQAAYCLVRKWWSMYLVMVDCKHAIHPAYHERQAHKQNTSCKSTVGNKYDPEPFAFKRDSSWLGVALDQS